MIEIKSKIEIQNIIFQYNNRESGNSIKYFFIATFNMSLIE